MDFGYKMKKKIIILLLILLPFQGMIYSMPVPSQGMQSKHYKIHAGGGDAMPFFLAVIGLWASSRVLYLGTRRFINDEKDDDALGGIMVIFGASAFIFSGVILIFAGTDYY